LNLLRGRFYSNHINQFAERLASALERALRSFQLFEIFKDMGEQSGEAILKGSDAIQQSESRLYPPLGGGKINSPIVRECGKSLKVTGAEGANHSQSRDCLGYQHQHVLSICSAVQLAIKYRLQRLYGASRVSIVMHRLKVHIRSSYPCCSVRVTSPLSPFFGRNPNGSGKCRDCTQCANPSGPIAGCRRFPIVFFKQGQHQPMNYEQCTSCEKSPAKQYNGAHSDICFHQESIA